MEKTTVYLTDDLQAQLKSLARRKKVPEAHVIREALAEYVAKETPMPKSLGIIDEEFAPGVDSTNVKQWIRENWAKDLEAKWARQQEAADTTER
ncbi:MAG TPA: CopG family transcriptional regulator [Chloroflexota bacterium]